jgi:GntR family transcriptional regulator
MELKEGIPRHTQITNWLRKQIESGIYEPEEKLPSENELAKMFDVSRVTIRRAMQSLENESVIYRCQGLGSFVSDERAPHTLVRLTDFNEDMSMAGINPSSKVLRFEPVEAPQWLSDRLKIDSDNKVLRVDRLRLGDDEPIAFDTTWLPIFYGQLLDIDQLKNETIYSILEQKYDITITKGCYRMSASLAEPEVADALQVEPATALFLIDRLSFTIGEKPVYYQKRYYRNDKVMYEMTLERATGTKGESMPIKEFIPVFTEH